MQRVTSLHLNGQKWLWMHFLNHPVSGRCEPYYQILQGQGHRENTKQIFQFLALPRNSPCELFLSSWYVWVAFLTLRWEAICSNIPQMRLGPQWYVATQRYKSRGDRVLLIHTHTPFQDPANWLMLIHKNSCYDVNGLSCLLLVSQWIDGENILTIL